VTVSKKTYEKLQKAAGVQGKSVARLVTDYAEQLEVPVNG